MTKSSLFAMLALASTAVSAQGSFDFSRVPGLAADPSIQIDLPAAMLGFVTEAARASDPGAAEALAGIRGVRVLVYEDVDDAGSMLATIEEASRMLESEGWERMVYVNDGEDKVRMYVKLGGESLAGMTVMVIDGGGEAVFVNIDGTVDPATLGKLANSFGMGGILDDVTGLGSIGSGAAAPSSDPSSDPDLE